LLAKCFLKSISIPNSRLVKWNAHNGQGMILNVDDSSIGNLGILGFRGLIQNGDGAWISGFVGNIGFSNILHTEYLAVYHGLRLAWVLGISNLVCYLDLKSTIKLI